MARLRRVVRRPEARDGRRRAAAAFAIVELLVIACGARRPGELVTTPRLRREGAGRPASRPSVRVATFAALAAGLANADIVSFRSDNIDHDQHVAWTMEIAHQGVVPDRYEATDTVDRLPAGPARARRVDGVRAGVAGDRPQRAAAAHDAARRGAWSAARSRRSRSIATVPTPRRRSISCSSKPACVDRPEPGPVQRALLGVAALLRERTPGGGPVSPRARCSRASPRCCHRMPCVRRTPRRRFVHASPRSSWPD